MKTDAWIEITDKHTRKGLFKNFSDRLAFKADTKEFPGIKEPSPSVTYQVSSIWETEPDVHNKILTDFHTNILKAFRRCVQEDQWLYTTDVFHYDYRFYPRVPFKGNDPDSWKVPLFPNGEYSIFVPKSCSFGLFGHPWEQTICIFGESLVSAVYMYKPELFRYMIRKNGKPVAKPHNRFRAG